MPRTSLREVLEAIASTAEGLTDEKDAVALLSLHLGRLQDTQHTDEMEQLVKVRGEAEQALRACEALARTNKVVQSHRVTLAKALEPLKRLQSQRVEETRRKAERDRDGIKLAMARLTSESPVNIDKLRELAAAEYARAGRLDGVLKDAAAHQIAVTPSPAKVAFADNATAGAAEWTDTVCAAAFAKYTWFEFKDLRKSGKAVDLPGLERQRAVTDEVMWKLYQFRRHVVDGLIEQLHREFPDAGLMFKSSGSEDIESDLDITVASNPPGDDVKAMRRFNAAIKSRFGRPPGRVFDTNLYARDYRAIEDNMTRGREGAPPQDRNIDEPMGPMAKMSGIDQDVATLMKQRRFLDEATFTAMWTDLRDSVTSKEDKQRIQQRFEEAEAVYLLTAQEKVEAIRTRIEAKRLALLERSSSGKGKLTTEEVQAFKAFDKAKLEFEKARQAHDLRATQELLPVFLDLMEESFPDEVMDATDEQYAERMGQLRDDQARLAANLAGHAQEGPDCDAIHRGQDHATWLAEQNALKARIMQAQFTNIVFANEAYVSQGAIKHVVAGIQASTPEKKRAVLEDIQPGELLQSTNEQLADFFKDMKHMEHAEKAARDATARRRASGEAFVHASKYLSRLLDAAAMLEEKYQGDADIRDALATPAYALCELGGAASPRDLQVKVDAQLVKLRKSSAIPGDAKAELAFDDVRKLFQVGSVAELRTLIMAFSREFNRRVRQLRTFQDAQHVDRATEAAYFRPAAR